MITGYRNNTNKYIKYKNRITVKYITFYFIFSSVNKLISKSQTQIFKNISITSLKATHVMPLAGNLLNVWSSRDLTSPL